MKKGSYHSEETKKKISEKSKGRQPSEETRKKLSEASKRQIPWNKNGHLSEEHKIKLSGLLKGDKNPFYGKCHSDEARKKMSESRRGEKNYNYGKHIPTETKRKMSIVKKGKHHSEETKKKLSKIGKIKVGEKNNNWKGGKVKIFCKTCGKEKYVFPSQNKNGYGKFCSIRCNSIWTIKYLIKNKDTDIERLIEDELIKRDIPYTKQIPLLGITIVDFLLPYDAVIYCDGSYWHSLKGRKESDMNQDYVLGFYGYKVFRFTDKEINKSAKKCIDKLEKYHENYKKHQY